MAPTQTLIVKMTNGTDMRRFTCTEPLTWASLSERVKSAFELTDQTFKLTYMDDENDCITMSTNDELTEAVNLALASTPTILRLTVRPIKKDSSNDTREASTDSACGTANPDSLDQQLRPFLNTLAKQLPAALGALPENLRTMIPDAELDIGATIAANIAANIADVAAAKQNGADPFCAPHHPPGATPGVHEGVTCDKSGMSPIVGDRYHLVGHNYDLCEAEFLKLTDKEKGLFRKIKPPPGGAPEAAAPAPGPETPPPANNPLRIHPGVECDRSGQCPIVGVRHHLRGHNYDICQAEFDKLPATEKLLYEAIEPPALPPPAAAAAAAFGAKAFAAAGCGPGAWRPAPWGCRGMGGWRAGMGGGPRSTHGSEGGGPKLAARFVRDVTIFDSTQMSPGTTFTKIWRLKNVGDMPWPAGTRMLFVGGDQMTTDTSVPLSRDTPVQPGEEVDVAVEMTAPTELGRYIGYWRLTGPHLRRKFGQRVWCHVQVVDPSQPTAFEDVESTIREIAQKKSDLAATEQDIDADMDDKLAEEMDAEKPSGTPVATPTPDASMQACAVASTSEPVVPAPPPPAPIEREMPEAIESAPPLATISNDGHDDGSAMDETTSDDGLLIDAADGDTPSGVMASLMAMGFKDTVMNEAAIATHGDDIEACARALAAASEWDSLLDDLVEMGFTNLELNKTLMLKNAGNVKRTVKDLVEA